MSGKPALQLVRNPASAAARPPVPEWQLPPRGAAALLQTAVRQPARHLWFFSSSEAVGHLAPHGEAADWAAARAVATHPRIAERAAQLGFGRVAQARPTLAAVVACIQSMRP